MPSQHARPNYLSAPTASALANPPIAVSPDELPAATLQGGAGDDTLQLLEGGTFDLTLPAVFAGIETIRGSDQHDTIVLDAERFAGVAAFDGGVNAAASWDVLALKGASFDFAGRTLTGIDRITLQTDNAVLVAPNLAVAMLASGIAAQNDRLEALTVTFTPAQIATLHRQGIDIIVDAVGTHANAAPTMQNLHGDRIEATAGQTLFVDAGRNAVIADDDGAYTLLNVTAPRGLDAPGRLRIDPGGAVALSAGYAAGSIVTVGGTEVGMLWEASDAGLIIAFNQESANSARVQEIVRAVTFTTAETPPQASREQLVTITLTDEGGRRAAATVTIEQDVVIPPPEITLSHNRVQELTLDGTLVGILTARATGIGDSFTYRLVEDADSRFALQGDRLVVVNGARLDYEQSRSHVVKVRATAADGTTIDQTFTIAIDDLADESNSIGGSDGTRGGTDTRPDNPGEPWTYADRILTGGRGDDRLVGGEGRDRILGKTGNDVLRGGENADVFVFDTKPHKKTNVDRIQDFEPRLDSIWLENNVFKKLGKKGTLDSPAMLSKAMFWKGATAHDKSDRIIYDAKTGALFYDADGTGKTAAMKIAVLSQNLKSISHKDFFVI